MDYDKNVKVAIMQRWQDLSDLRPSNAPPLAPILTWYVDHNRIPQCFNPRIVYVHRQPNRWHEVIKRAWADLLLPHQSVEVVPVHPQPVMMEQHIAAHVLVLQQQAPGFTTVLLTSLDNARPGQYRRIATMIPMVLQRDLLLALAFHNQDCANPANECDAWIGDQDMDPHTQALAEAGVSCTASIHRQPLPPEDPDLWEQTRPKHTNHPVPLCLQAVLPGKSTELAVTNPEDSNQMLWFHNEAWKHELEDEDMPKLLPLPDGMHIPDSAYWSLITPQPTDLQTHDRFSLYLDGSANGTEAGWSVIVVANHPQGDTFVGCLLGTVQLASHHQDWFGADTSDNISAELTAMVIAQNLAMRWKSPATFCIRPDLSLSRTVATATTTCRTNQTLAAVCGTLGLWLGTTIEIIEVRGHQGHAWNELADAVAKWAMHQHSNPVGNAFQQLHLFATHPHDVDWAWMQTTHTAVAACFPPLIQQQIMQFTEPTQAFHITPTERSTTASSLDPTQWNIAVSTANVLASEVWATNASGSKRTGQRTLRFDQQWHQRKLHVIGIQEARTPQGRFQSPHYHILASGALHKRAPLYGCELWIHKTLPVTTDANGHPVVLGKATLTVQHADPRRLFVEAKLDTTVYTFVVLHVPSLAAAPGTPDPVGAATQWWKETALLYTRHATANAQWVFADANAPLGQGDGVHYAAHGAEAPNRASELFEEFIQQHQLTVPCTFPHIHTGPTTTWTHSTGKKSRKDYILISRAISTLATASWVDVQHDTTFAHEDHLPVVLECQGWLPTPLAVKPVGWDEKALVDPTRVAQFQAALHTLPLPTWSTCIDDHAALYEKQVLALGRQFLARPPAKVRTVKLQEDTLAAIAFKRHILDVGRRTDSMHHPELKLELRAIEKEVARRVHRDVRQFYDELLQQLQESGELSNHRLVYRLLHRLGRKRRGGHPGPRPLPLIQKPDGTMARSYLDQQQTWMDMFSQIEAGVPKTWEELQQQHAKGRMDMPHHTREPGAFPGQWQIRRLLSQLKRDKVPGPNLMPPALLKVGGSVVAKQLSILFAKAAAESREPMHWKGGVLIPLWKGKMAPHVAAGYRSIFISNYTTKLYHQSFRAHLVHAWEHCLTHLQCGGRKGIGADMAHHLVQCHQSYCKQKSLPSAALFF